MNKTQKGRRKKKNKQKNYFDNNWKEFGVSSTRRMMGDCFDRWGEIEDEEREYRDPSSSSGEEKTNVFRTDISIGCCCCQFVGVGSHTQKNTRTVNQL